MMYKLKFLRIHKQLTEILDTRFLDLKKSLALITDKLIKTKIPSLLFGTKPFLHFVIKLVNKDSQFW